MHFFFPKEYHCILFRSLIEFSDEVYLGYSDSNVTLIFFVGFLLKVGLDFRFGEGLRFDEYLFGIRL